MASLSDEWVELLNKDLARGGDLAASPFWRLALHSLPLGVDPEDPRVQEGIAKIKEHVERRERDNQR